jgi:hypothetical protein
MTDPCKFEKVIMEMAGDIKVLLNEFKAMNGTLKETKFEVAEHKSESNVYRRKVDILWAVIHASKWVIIFLFGTGILYTWIADKVAVLFK